MKTDRKQKYSKLNDFIRNQMRMAHIYQPVMLIEILKNGGVASVSDIAKALLGYDISQVEYYAQTLETLVEPWAGLRRVCAAVPINCRIEDTLRDPLISKIYRHLYR